MSNISTSTYYHDYYCNPYTTTTTTTVSTTNSSTITILGESQQDTVNVHSYSVADNARAS